MMLKKYVLFDFETTGLYPPEAQPVQLSYLLLGEDFSPQQAKNFYFTVPYIPKEVTAIHGLTVEKLRALKAQDISVYQDEIYQDFSSTELICVAHNFAFDSSFYFHFIHSIPIKGFCTMEYYTSILKIPGKNKPYKWPRVSEVLGHLHIHETKVSNECGSLFCSGKGSFHDSRFDVTCILQMIQTDPDLKQTLCEASSAKES